MMFLCTNELLTQTVILNPTLWHLSFVIICTVIRITDYLRNVCAFCSVQPDDGMYRDFVYVCVFCSVQSIGCIKTLFMFVYL